MSRHVGARKRALSSDPVCQAIVRSVRCPLCGNTEDRVVDSRIADGGLAIRRRRECQACHRRFTTFERAEEVALWIVKRSGRREPFEQAKVVAGVRAAAKNRPVTEEDMALLASEIEDALRTDGLSEIPSEEVGLRVLDRLRAIDDVAAVRFASVYKEFAAADDFRREVRLLSKASAPKRGS